jgi:hypothetical protein|tara:strand:- start:216 stop:590 length:375 start_codon:yes stop_codon:yes gene_type:complete
MFGLLAGVVSTAVDCFKQRQETKRLEATAQRNHMYRMAQGEIEYQAQVRADNQNGWKDEFVLVIVSLPILVLAYAVFFGDAMMKEKLDIFFQYFNGLPQWYQWLLIGIFGAIYGLKPAAGMFKK